MIVQGREIDAYVWVYSLSRSKTIGPHDIRKLWLIIDYDHWFHTLNFQPHKKQWAHSIFFFVTTLPASRNAVRINKDAPSVSVAATISTPRWPTKGSSVDNAGMAFHSAKGRLAHSQAPRNDMRNVNGIASRVFREALALSSLCSVLDVTLRTVAEDSVDRHGGGIRRWCLRVRAHMIHMVGADFNTHMHHCMHAPSTTH